MATILYNEQGDALPRRPSLDEPEEKVRALKMGLDTYYASKECDLSVDVKERLLSDLIGCYASDCDAYELTTKLANAGWEVDKRFVGKMDYVITGVNTALSQMEQEWQAKYKPVCPLPVGTKVNIIMLGIGTIDKVSLEHVCAYEIKLDNIAMGDVARVLVLFEDAVAEKV